MPRACGLTDVKPLQTRMQVISSGRGAAALAVVGGGGAHAAVAASTSLKNLWRGVNSVVLGAGPAHALHFATYEYCKDKFEAEGKENNTLAFAAAGACATFAHDALMTPFDGTLRLCVCAC